MIDYTIYSLNLCRKRKCDRTFDKRGLLWIIMSYSNDIVRIEPWALVSCCTYTDRLNF